MLLTSENALSNNILPGREEVKTFFRPKKLNAMPLTRRQRIIINLIRFRWEYIKQNISTLGAIQMAKEEATLQQLKNKLPYAYQQQIF